MVKRIGMNFFNMIKRYDKYNEAKVRWFKDGKLGDSEEFDEVEYKEKQDETTYKGIVIKIREVHSGFYYTLYITNPRWKRVRMSSIYGSKEMANIRAMEYIDEYGYRINDKYPGNLLREAHVRWFKDGKLGDKEEIKFEDESDFEKGDLAIIDGKHYYYTEELNDNKGNWLRSSESIVLRVEDVSRVDNLQGYTGQVIKLYRKWPWFQTTNIKKLKVNPIRESKEVKKNYLKFSIFDVDDNLLYMSSPVYLDIYDNGEWKPIEIPHYKTNEFIKKYRTRLRNRSFFDSFKEQSDEGKYGNDAFTIDVKNSIKRKMFGPSWDDFIKTLIEGRIFLIVTGRGQESESLKKGIRWIIFNYLNNEERSIMKENLSKFYDLFGGNQGNIIENYLDNCEFVGVMSKGFKNNHDIPKMNIGDYLSYAKSLVIKNFLKRIKEYGKKLEMPVKVGFSDDRTKTIEYVAKFMSGEKSIEEPIEYYLFDTSGGGKRKIKI